MPVEAVVKLFKVPCATVEEAKLIERTPPRPQKIVVERGIAVERGVPLPPPY